MLDKEFDELSMKEKYTLQKLMKKQANLQSLTEEEQLLYEKHHARWVSEESKAKSKWPIIIGLLIVTVFAVVRQCG